MKVIKFITYILCYLFYPLSYLVPRTKEILVFGSFKGAFNDNSKYLFLYANENKANIRPIWISTCRKTVAYIRHLGFETYWVASPLGFWYALRGKYWFVNSYTSDILFCLSGGAKIINLWHGLPWKCIEFGIKKGTLAKRYSREDKWDVFFHPACFMRPDYVLSGGEMITGIFAYSFRIDKLCCLPYGYPRNILLTKPKESVLAHIERYESNATAALTKKMAQYKLVYIYMPTWRDSQKDLFAKGIDLEALNKEMQEQKALAILKPHPNTAKPEHADFTNLVFMDSTTDVYSILPLTDVLITDYSSVMFDYPLMHGKGMILYQYDYEEYIAEREFNFPLEGNIIGRKVTSFDELCETIRKKNFILSEKEREGFIRKFWGETMKLNSCEEILKKVIC
ncbi:MAG: CDP-glycerol glycerophosphotransferase family protein [Paludibacteraceae bacterium]|nr:CDP-glycerol glycerophosphotransferase family protein [Paludibacteraceae bacterium]